MKGETLQWMTQKKNNKDLYEQFYANKLDNLKKMDKFLEAYSPPRIKNKQKGIGLLFLA